MRADALVAFNTFDNCVHSSLHIVLTDDGLGRLKVAIAVGSPSLPPCAGAATTTCPATSWHASSATEVPGPCMTKH